MHRKLHSLEHIEPDKSNKGSPREKVSSLLISEVRAIKLFTIYNRQEVVRAFQK